MKKTKLLLIFAALTLVGCDADSKVFDNPGYTPTNLSSIGAKIDGVELDGKLDDVVYGKTPYTAVSCQENRDPSKYQSFSSMPNCTSKTYVGFGTEGLFILGINDDPVVNLSVPKIYNRTGYEFYVCSPDVSTQYENVFEITADPDGAILVRKRYDNGKGGAFRAIPAVGAYCAGQLYSQGYGVEIYLPYDLINIEGPINQIGVATAMIRLDSVALNSDHYCWELLEMYTSGISHTNFTTFPQFDENGCKPTGDGETFENPHNIRADVSYDRGDDAKVSFTCGKIKANAEVFLKDNKFMTGDFYFESKVKLDGIYSGDDPRVGICAKSKPDASGFYSQAFNFLELDKTVTQGYGIIDLCLLPRIKDATSTRNDWAKCQRTKINSLVNDAYEFKLGIHRKGKVIAIYVNDNYVSERNDFDFIEQDSEVTVGLTSWNTSATFTEYKLYESDVDAYVATLKNDFRLDSYIANNSMDFYKTGEIISISKKNVDGLVNYKDAVSSDIYLKSTITFNELPDDTYKFNDARSGFGITVLKNGGDRLRFYFLLRADYINHDGNIVYADAYTINNETPVWGTSMNIATAVPLTLGKTATLGMYIEGMTAKILIDGNLTFTVDLGEKGLVSGYNVGFAAWKSCSSFTNFSLVRGTTESSNAYANDLKN